MLRKIYEGRYNFFLIVGLWHLQADFATPLVLLKNSKFLWKAITET